MNTYTVELAVGLTEGTWYKRNITISLGDFYPIFLDFEEDLYNTARRKMLTELEKNKIENVSFLHVMSYWEDVDIDY